MRFAFLLVLLALADIATAQTVVTVPAQTITVPIPAQSVAVPARTVSVTIPASTVTVPASTVQYTVPSYQLTIGTSPLPPPPPPPPPPPMTGNCGLTLGGTVTFCDTFDTPKNDGTRSGDLDPNVWGVSRATGFLNLGQGWYNPDPATQLVGCSGTSTVTSPHDVIVCNGQLREASNDNLDGGFDNGGVTTLAMYPKQPFDFAGRTGTVSFDISNDTQGNHAAWPEFWLSDLPVPTPFNHFDSWRAFPVNGLGVRMAANAMPGQFGLCPNSNNLTQTRWTVDSGVVVRNNVYEDVDYQGTDFGSPSAQPLKLNILDCVIASDGKKLNHVEVRVGQSQVDVYATDAGVAPSSTTLKHIASFTNANLSFTRGLIWMEDVHYNADKETLSNNLPSQRQHTFIWDNVAFDGPFTYRDFSYDALDANTAGTGIPAWNLGKVAAPGKTASWNVLGVPANPTSAAVRVLFNFSLEAAAGKPNLQVIVNGHAHTVAWPYPESDATSWRTFAYTIPVTDLVAGTNVVQLGADMALITSNVNIVLVNVPGGVPVLPGSNNAYPAH